MKLTTQQASHDDVNIHQLMDRNESNPSFPELTGLLPSDEKKRNPIRQKDPAANRRSQPAFGTLRIDQHANPPRDDTSKGTMTRRIAVFLYGLTSYAIFFVTFVYAAGFLGNLLVPKSIDSPAQGPLAQALLVNTLLLVLFAVQHSLMARPAFKRMWTKIVPEPAERSTYVLFSSLALILMFWQWRPMGGVVWDVDNPAGRALLLSLFAFGFLLVLVATLLINHFDLFGLRQVTLYLQGREYTRLRFKTPGLYRIVRHPLYVGWLLAFWATPTMTAAHLLFAIATTTYILMAIRWEERDLLKEHGAAYANYRSSVPMLIPTGKKQEVLQEALN